MVRAACRGVATGALSCRGGLLSRMLVSVPTQNPPCPPPNRSDFRDCVATIRRCSDASRSHKGGFQVGSVADVGGTSSPQRDNASVVTALETAFHLTGVAPGAWADTIERLGYCQPLDRGLGMWKWKEDGKGSMRIGVAQVGHRLRGDRPVKDIVANFYALTVPRRSRSAYHDDAASPRAACRHAPSAAGPAPSCRSVQQGDTRRCPPLSRS